MYRQPDKLLAALEALTPIMIGMGLGAAQQTGNPVIFMPLHKGADGFMSARQFETFYWPALKKVVMALVEEGIIPVLFAEGSYNTRLEIIGDITKGKAIYHFESKDIFRAKEVLGDRVCIRGNVSASLLCMGTAQDGRDYCKKLIDVVGKGGGFIMDSAVTLDEARPENVKAMVDFTREYGVYG